MILRRFFCVKSLAILGFNAISPSMIETKFLDNIKEKLQINNKNFKVLEDDISNNLIFNNAKRIVTYSGTAFLEFACYGKKSIIISDVLPKKYQNQIATKPKSKSHYEQLLLEEINKWYQKD